MFLTPHNKACLSPLLNLNKHNGNRHNQRSQSGAPRGHDEKGILITMSPSDRPHSCRMIGLACRDCVAGSALQLALVCGRIPSLDVERIFFTMYDDEACQSMASEFCGVYREAVRGSSVIVMAEPALWMNTAEPVPAI